MRPTQRYDMTTGKWVDIEYQDGPEYHYVMNDVPEFMSPDGKYVGGRSQWREHLKRTDSMEMGHSDMRYAERQWRKRQADFQESLKAPGAEPAAIKGEMKPMERSDLGQRMANRLDGRPTPDLKTMIQLTLNEARRRR